MRETNRSFQLFFDELLHEPLFTEAKPCALYDRALLHDADIAATMYTCNTSAWD